MISEDRTKVQLTSEPAVAAFTFLVDMFKNGWFPEEGAVGSAEEAARVTTDYFLTEQQVQSWNQSSIYISTVRQQAPEMVWGMNPAWQNVRATTPFFSGNWSITSISKQVPAACEWIKFMVKADNLGFWCSAANQVPGSVAALDYWTVDREIRQFVELQSPALFANQDSSAYYQEAKLICAPHLQAACLGQKTVEQALEDAQAELQAIVDEQLAKQSG
ncbi:MAG: hypothetical protein GX605_01820 [Chloroflexi bacterium]|nr:hypothetical protein [Chloroflexota bacterium]